MKAILARPLTMIVIVVLLVVSAFVIYRLAEYQRDEPLREGISALKAGDTSTALSKLTPFAESGNELAQRTIGEIYAYGEGIPVDVIQAGIWFRRAECRSAVPGAYEYTVSRNYLLGRADGPVRQSAERAAMWLQRAAEAGHREAQRVLADPNETAKLGMRIEPTVSDYWKQHRR